MSDGDGKISRNDGGTTPPRHPGNAVVIVCGRRPRMRFKPWSDRSLQLFVSSLKGIFLLQHSSQRACHGLATLLVVLRLPLELLQVSMKLTLKLELA